MMSKRVPFVYFILISRVKGVLYEHQSYITILPCVHEYRVAFRGMVLAIICVLSRLAVATFVIMALWWKVLGLLTMYAVTLLYLAMVAFLVIWHHGIMADFFVTRQKICQCILRECDRWGR